MTSVQGPRTVAELWATFKATVYLAPVPDHVELQLKAAFYGGVRGYIKLFDAMDPGDDLTDGDIALLDEIERELEEFLQDFMEQHPLIQGGTA